MSEPAPAVNPVPAAPSKPFTWRGWLFDLAVWTAILTAAFIFRGWYLSHLIGGEYRWPALLFDVACLAVFILLLRLFELGLRSLFGRATAGKPRLFRFVVNSLHFMLVFGLAGALLTTLAQMHPQRISCTQTPKDLGMAFTEERIASGAGALAAWHIPALAPNRPIVVLTHGVGTNKQNFLPLARYVNELGLDCLMFDFRAHGDSEGLISTLGLREADDLAAVCRWLAAKHPGRPLYAMGHSMGGAAVVRAAAENGFFAKIVLDSTFARAENVGRLTMSRFFIPEPVQTAWWAQMRFWGRTFGGVDLDAIRSDELIAKIPPCPIFIVHGTADATAPLADAKLLKQNAGDRASLWIVEGAGHLECFNHPEYAGRLKAFFLGESPKNSAPTSPSASTETGTSPQAASASGR